MAIEVKDLTFAYPKSNNNALEHISVIIEKGEKVAIIGQNGAGKSTMVKTIDNIYKPTIGQIIIDGLRPQRWSVMYFRILMTKYLMTM